MIDAPPDRLTGRVDLGYTDQVEKKRINVRKYKTYLRLWRIVTKTRPVEGENLKLDYVKKVRVVIRLALRPVSILTLLLHKTPSATVPLLLASDGTIHDSTHKAIKWLIDNAPADAKYGTKTNQELIDLVHQPIVDPNFFLVAAKSAEELSAKRDAQPSIPVIFFTSRMYWYRTRLAIEY